jgi:hypothetical protein
MFDGQYFLNIEKIGAFTPIKNLKKSIKQNNLQQTRNCTIYIKTQYPQLFEFMKNHKVSLGNFVFEHRFFSVIKCE